MNTASTPRQLFAGKKVLVVGIANEHSIAYGCAAAFRELGAELAITYLNPKSKPHVEPHASKLEAPIFMPLDVSTPGELEAVFDRIRQQWGRLDVIVHSIAWAPKDDLQGGLLNCTAQGFAKAMDISCHSFVRMARLAAPLMTDGGSMFAMSYLGANRVVPNYNVMGPVKAALEACCRYLAYELGAEKKSACTQFRPGRSRPAPPPDSRTSTCCWPGPQKKRHSANWSISWTSASPAPIWRRRTRGDCPEKRCLSTAASTSWPSIIMKVC